MSGPAYPPARAVAARAANYFASFIDRDEGAFDHPTAQKPDAATIEELVSSAFWASLRREEGRSPRISIAIVAPDQTASTMRFARALPVTSMVLTRLGPAVEGRGVHLGVWRLQGDLEVWGTTRSLPNHCFVLEVVDPGLLVIKRAREPHGAKYANVAVLQGDTIKVVDETGGDLPKFTPSILPALGLDTPFAWTDPTNIVVQLALAMRAHGRGGSLLLVPARSDAWQDSILLPLPYLITPPFDGLRDPKTDLEAHADPFSSHDSLGIEVRRVAGLTAVDGATVLNDRLQLLGFGAKISRARAKAAAQSVILSEAVEGARAALVDLSRVGGTRHQSAAQFVHDQRDALALVASQDGRFTAFAWSPDDEAVRAHRIESLLL
jgi:hypothetical protein